MTWWVPVPVLVLALVLAPASAAQPEDSLSPEPPCFSSNKLGCVGGANEFCSCLTSPINQHRVSRGPLSGFVERCSSRLGQGDDCHRKCMSMYGLLAVARSERRRFFKLEECVGCMQRGRCGDAELVEDPDEVSDAPAEPSALSEALRGAVIKGREEEEKRNPETTSRAVGGVRG